MKFYFVVLSFIFCLSLNLHCQERVSYDILSYYSEYFVQQKIGKIKDELPYYEIKKKGKEYYTTSSVDEPMPVIVDIPNGFIEFTDEGTGGGIYKFQMSLFKTKDKITFLLLNIITFDGLIEEGKIFVYLVESGKWENVKGKIFPRIPYEELFEKSFYNSNKSKIDSFVLKYGDEFLYIFDLPRYGTDIKVRFKLKGIIDVFQYQDEFKNIQDPEKRFIKQIQSNIVRENFLIKWNKEEGKFYFKIMP